MRKGLQSISATATGNSEENTFSKVEAQAHTQRARGSF